MLRRAFVAAAALAPMAAAANDASLAARCVDAIARNLSAIPPGPALLNSYIVNSGADAGDFDLTQANAAYVYDNALAGLALLAAGFRDAAIRIAAALALAQDHDRYWQDGRLRNAYLAGPAASPAKLPGWWDAKASAWREDPYQAGSQTGPLAWAMLLWAALDFLPAANRAADWLNARLRAASGYYGGFYGFEPDPQKLIWQSTEQNTDLYVAFSKLGRMRDAAHAGSFVRAMFNPQTARFGAGLGPDGKPNPLLAADAGIWPYLAGIGAAASAANAIAALRHGAGVGFSTASQTLWPEGTAFAALALAGRKSPEAAGFLASLTAQISPGGYLYAAASPSLATGLSVGPPPPGQPPVAFNYYRRPALAPTAWTALAAMGFNPLST